MNKVFILVPALKDDGVIKGAIAMANGLSDNFDVNLVVLKKILPYKTFIKPNIKIVLMSKSCIWLTKYRAYRKILIESSDIKPISISMGFSADLINLLAKKHATVIASVRASMPITYITSYGLRGHIWSGMHSYVLRKMDYVLSMSQSMTKQLKKQNVKKIKEIGNFIDEESIDNERVDNKHKSSGNKRFVFVGSLTLRKKVDLIIKSVFELKSKGVLIYVDIVGDGELRKDLEQTVQKLDLCVLIKFHGHHPKPYSILQKADFFILPSLAEGVSRASLEALFFGVPCILRNVDANSELIKNGVNGYLFNTNDEFVNLLKEFSISNELNFKKVNLIPKFFSYKNNIIKLTTLIEEIKG